MNALVRPGGQVFAVGTEREALTQQEAQKGEVVEITDRFGNLVNVAVVKTIQVDEAGHNRLLLEMIA